MAVCGYCVRAGKDQFTCYLYSLGYTLGVSDIGHRTEKCAVSPPQQPSSSLKRVDYTAFWEVTDNQDGWHLRWSLSASHTETLRWIQPLHGSFQTSGLIATICLPGVKNFKARKEQRERNERIQLGEDSRETDWRDRLWPMASVYALRSIHIPKTKHPITKCSTTARSPHPQLVQIY